MVPPGFDLVRGPRVPDHGGPPERLFVFALRGGHEICRIADLPAQGQLSASTAGSGSPSLRLAYQFSVDLAPKAARCQALHLPGPRSVAGQTIPVTSHVRGSNLQVRGDGRPRDPWRGGLDTGFGSDRSASPLPQARFPATAGEPVRMGAISPCPRYALWKSNLRPMRRLAPSDGLLYYIVAIYRCSNHRAKETGFGTLLAGPDGDRSPPGELLLRAGQSPKKACCDRLNGSWGSQRSRVWRFDGWA